MGDAHLKSIVGALAVTCLILATASPRAIQPSCLLDEPQATAILFEFSGVAAKDYATRITALHRTPASSGFHDAIELIRRFLDRFGLKGSQIEAYEPDAPQPLSLRKRPGPPVWEVQRAELRAIDPPRKIASFEEEPIGLARYSRAGRVIADLVDVGPGVREDDYAGKAVTGKLVLATGYANTVEQIAVGKHGAAGVVISGASSYSEDTGWGYPDMVNWQVLSPRAIDGREPTFAFVISEAEGARLRADLTHSKPVRLSAVVESTLAEGPQEILTVAIPGARQPDEQVLLLGHLDHVRPSANDNASGSALMIEVARTLQRLIDSGRLPRPARSIRFLWMTEGAGTVGYLNAHPTLGEYTVAGMNLDMVGEYLVPGTGPLRITRTPDWLPSYLVDTVMNLVEFLDTQVPFVPTGSRSFMNVRLGPFSPSSDHYTLNDDAVRVPTVLLHHAPDPFHHANIDQPDKIDPTEMRRTGFIAAATAYFLANAGPGEAARLAGEVYAGASRRLGDVVAQGLLLVARAAPTELQEAFTFAERKMAYTLDREKRAVESVTRLAAVDVSTYVSGLEAQAAAHRSALEARHAAIAGGRPGSRRPTPAESRAGRIIPKRRGGFICERWRQDLDLAALSADQRAWLSRYEASLRQSYMRIPAMLNYMDGVRSLLDIRDRVSAEYFDFLEGSEYAGHHEDMSLDYRRIPIEDVVRLMEVLKAGGLITIEERR
jgi:aminopeptidase YwaD